MNKPRVMYILREFPQISQTYIKSEIEAVLDDYEISVISLRKVDIPYKNHVPYRFMDDPATTREAVEEFRPQILHSHYLIETPNLGKLSRQTNTPFTIRAHSFDAIRPGKKTVSDFIFSSRKDYIPSQIRRAVPFINDDLCLGILTFPFTRQVLERAGIRSEKIHDCFPVVNYHLFHDTSPNGQSIMNVGACIPKKRMGDFLELAKELPDLEFNLFAMGYQVEKIIKLNKNIGNPVNIIPPVEPDNMPSEYKKHRWLVYTASRDHGTVGWPMAIAEAQASGVGVCMPNIRPDLRDYVGKAGFLYNSISEVADIISKPFPEEMQQIGFEHAKKSDIFKHKVILTDLWRKAATSSN